MATKRTKPRGSRRPAELFLSHASSDHRFTERLADVLNDHGVPTWYSEANINAEQWHDEIGKALARCDWFAVALTPPATRSQWVKDELLYALGDPRYRGRVIPLMIRTCKPDRLSWTLQNRQMIEFRGDFDAGCTELLRRWGLGYRR